MAILFYVIWAIWFLSEILLNMFFRSGKHDKKHQDKGTINIIWIAIVIAISAGIIVTYNLDFPISHSLIVAYIGLLVIIAGMAFRFYSIYSLGRMFTVNVTIRNKHVIKKDGIYGLIRHPSYSGSVISFIGFGLSLNNWISLVIISAVFIFVILIRIRTEEKILTEQFGQEYSDYMKTTYRLIPWIY